MKIETGRGEEGGLGCAGAMAVVVPLLIADVLLGAFGFYLIVMGDVGDWESYHLGGFLTTYSAVSLFFLVIGFPLVIARLPRKPVMVGIGLGIGWMVLCGLTVFLLEWLGPPGGCCTPGIRRTLINQVSLFGPALAWLFWAPLSWWLHLRRRP